ncbi:hypothetical protein, partial [Enterococcus hirae]|uniref:hypothetical protein n=1 Tax=Enterococcus hirae TaxID=1354 RepID=UPI002553CDAB
FFFFLFFFFCFFTPGDATATLYTFVVGGVGRCCMNELMEVLKEQGYPTHLVGCYPVYHIDE